MTKTLAIDLVFWRRYIEQQIGFVLPMAQERWLVNAVLAVLKELMIDEQTLVDCLDDMTIRQKLIDAILIPETRFFRDKQVVDFVADAFGRHICAHLDEPTPFVLASVGCSTGQELWSLAVALEYKRLAYAKLYNQTVADFELIGIDASVRSLTIAQSATYNERAFGQIPKPYRRFWKAYNKQWQIVPTLQKKAQFIKCNVFNEQEFETQLAHKMGALSLVLCQNMLIYFRRFDQQAILARMTTLIKPDGVLVLGAGEGLFWQQPSMKRLGNQMVNAWQKVI